MASPSLLQLICSLTGTVPLGSGKFASTGPFAHVPLGAATGSTIPIGTVAGSVSDVYSNNNLANTTIVSAASPTTLILSALNNPNLVNSAFLHIAYLLVENLDLVNSITLSRGATNPVGFLPAVASVNSVFAIPVADTTGSGTFKITVEGVQTGAITYNATPATLVSNINTALNSTYGASAIVSSGATLAAMILTCSGTSSHWLSSGSSAT